MLSQQNDSNDFEKHKRAFEEARIKALNQPAAGPTLLWSTPAKAVSAATGAAFLAVKTGFKVGGWGLSFGREATHHFIGINQVLLEAVLRVAGRDVSRRTDVQLRQEEAENIVESWISAVHNHFSTASVLASTGFYLAETSLVWTEAYSTLGLSFLNSIFGCTESSRAVATIIAMMRNELDRPGLDGEIYKFNVISLLACLASFLFLQRSAKRKTAIEWRASGGDFTVWDIVLDDKGFRADVVGMNRKRTLLTASQSMVQSLVDEQINDEFGELEKQIELDAPASAVALSAEDQTQLTDDEIRQRIVEQLPAGSRAAITSETITLKTIKVDVVGPTTSNIEAPSGMIMVSEHLNHDGLTQESQQTIVFRTASKSTSRSEIRPDDLLMIQNLPTSEPIDADDGGVMMSSPLRRSEPPRQSESFEEPATFNPQPSDEHVLSNPSRQANQKKQRKTVETALPMQARRARSPHTRSHQEKIADGGKHNKVEKPGVIKKALKSLTPSQSSLALNRVVPSSSRSRGNSRSGLGNSLSDGLKPLTRKPIFPISTTQPTTPLMSPDGAASLAHEGQGGYFTVHEQRRESTYSQTDTYSIHSNDSRPSSPTMSRTHLRAANSISKTQSQTEIAIHREQDLQADDGGRHHRRSRSFVPSLYSMGTKDEKDEAIILAPKTPLPRRSIFEDNKMLLALANDGIVPGQFPKMHLIRTLQRFGRYATAVYGSHFLRIFGIASEHAKAQTKSGVSREIAKVEIHHEHDSFSKYTGLPANTIIRSTFVDDRGMQSKGLDSCSPLMHVVSIDTDSKAILLTCRGTLGLEDLLTDMACDFADIYWRGQQYQVHRGIRDAARRLLESKGGNITMASLKAALEEYPDFGLVFVGHSLGGAVAAILAIMLAEPSKAEPGESDTSHFVTATKPRMIPSTQHTSASRDLPPIVLPPGRPIHVYAYGTPATVSSSLRLATRGLITTIINGNDIIPYLSLGTLHDFRAIAHLLRSDVEDSLKIVRERAMSRIFKGLNSYIWAGLHQSSTAANTPSPDTHAGDALGEDAWMWKELCKMRSVMKHDKLYPPGEIFTLDAEKMYDRGFETSHIDDVDGDRNFIPLGRPATRIQFKWVKDVERRFNEVRFARTMFGEHAPATYERNLAALMSGVCDQGGQ